MSARNQRAFVTSYIDKAPPFARPICAKLRQVVLNADPEIEEVVKWGSPAYQKNGLVCSIGAFKRHVGLWFFKGAALKDPKKLFVVEGAGPKLMRSMSFTDVGQVDKKTLAEYIREAAELNTTGSAKVEDNRPITLPRELKQALTNNLKLKRFFDSLSYTHRKEYVRWIETAKREETRTERLKKTIRMLGKGIKHP